MKKLLVCHKSLIHQLFLQHLDWTLTEDRSHQGTSQRFLCLQTGASVISQPRLILFFSDTAAKRGRKRQSRPSVHSHTVNLLCINPSQKSQTSFELQVLSPCVGILGCHLAITHCGHIQYNHQCCLGSLAVNSADLSVFLCLWVPLFFFSMLILVLSTRCGNVTEFYWFRFSSSSVGPKVTEHVGKFESAKILHNMYSLLYFTEIKSIDFIFTQKQ